MTDSPVLGILAAVALAVWVVFCAAVKLRLRRQQRDAEEGDGDWGDDWWHR